MRIVFMGTPVFAVPAIEALVAAGHDLALVVTQPDRRRGRGHRVRRTDAAAAADRLGLDVAQPERVSGPEFRDRLRDLSAELFVVVAYGRILKRRVLEIPRWGCINAHASLLPHLRGAAPIQQAIFGGDSVTGVTTMKMDRGMDTGDMLLAREVPIGARDTAGDLHDRLAPVAAALLVETLARLPEIEPRPQDHDRATYAPRIEGDDLELDWGLDATTLDRTIRGLAPAPGARTRRDGELLKVLEAEPVTASSGLEAGSLFPLDRGCAVQCSGGALRLVRVGPAGRPPMPADAYLLGRPLQGGERLGTEG
ncbi:MAG: methionyl-tRNA formyltransferase [Gemmatimonadetes bacterium]|nr:methionyl-tRNA formyltransferase [Gemmatimonadota bacterium]